MFTEVEPHDATIRKQLLRAGFRLKKSRTRWGRRLSDQGGYQVINQTTGLPVVGECFDLDLVDVIAWFADIAAR